MSRLRTLCPLLGFLVVLPVSAEQQLVAVRSDQAPTIDGIVDDALWSRASAITSRDAVAGIDVTIRSVYTADEIFFLVQFPDAEENREHKTMHCDSQQERYRTGPEREDTFVLKWSMSVQPIDLSLSADTPYKADVWYWKSHRTDPAGHADDKHHIYSAASSPRAKKLRSKNGSRFFLTRRGDEGIAAYESTLHGSFVSDQMPKYALRTPQGSSADIKARGHWKDGVWTVEFRRKLDTANGDDVRFNPARSYVFGISRFEIAGRAPNPKIHEPEFGCGEVGERLTLRFG